MGGETAPVASSGSAPAWTARVAKASGRAGVAGRRSSHGRDHRIRAAARERLTFAVSSSHTPGGPTHGSTTRPRPAQLRSGVHGSHRRPRCIAQRDRRGGLACPDRVRQPAGRRARSATRARRSSAGRSRCSCPIAIAGRHVEHRDAFIGPPARAADGHRARPVGPPQGRHGVPGRDQPARPSRRPHGLQVFATVVDITARKAARGPAAPGPEARVDRAARRRHRPRLQQHAVRDPRLRRDARGGPRAGPARPARPRPRAVERRRDHDRRRAGDAAHDPAARVQPPPGRQPQGRRPQREHARDRADAPPPHRRAGRAAARARPDAGRVHIGSGPARPDPRQPRGQRARRDARGRPGLDRHRQRRVRRAVRGRALRRPGRGRTSCSP